MVWGRRWAVPAFYQTWALELKQNHSIFVSPNQRTLFLTVWVHQVKLCCQQLNLLFTFEHRRVRKSLNTTNIKCKIILGCIKSQRENRIRQQAEREKVLSSSEIKWWLHCTEEIHLWEALKQTLKLRSDHLSCAEILWTLMAEFQQWIIEFSCKPRWGTFTIF